jgi:biotin carboxyl carrier protein
MELEKLKELFYSTDKPNMKLSIEIAKSMGHQPFIDFYNQWLEILKFYQSRGAQNYSLIDCVETFKKRGNSIYIGDVKDAKVLDCFRLLADDCLGITLANTTFETLPEVFQNFKKLKSAKFYKNCIKKIPDWFYELTNLETLIFENNPIWIMPPEFAQFKKLKELQAPMPGRVLKIFVKKGDEIQIGENVLSLEAMKMENVLKAEGVGVVGAILISEGDVVDKGTVLIEFI